MKLPPPLPWPADLSCHPCVRGDHDKCRGFVVIDGEHRACSHQGTTCPKEAL